MKNISLSPILIVLIWVMIAFTALIGCGSATTAPISSSQNTGPTATTETATSRKAAIPAEVVPTAVPYIPAPKITNEVSQTISPSEGPVPSFEFPPHIAVAVAQIRSEAAKMLADAVPADSSAACGRLCETDFWGDYNWRTNKYENVPSGFEVKTEIGRGANVNARDENGKTPLCNTVLLPDPLLTALLLERGADPNSGNCYNNAPPLDPAIQHDDPSSAAMIGALLIDYGADVNADREGWTALHSAAAWGASNVVELLLNHGANVSAVSEFDIFGYERGYDGWPAYGTQALHMASALNEDPKVSAALLDWGADINVLARGRSPLHLAVGRNENSSVASLLLDRGADINSGEGGWTPLHSAASYPSEGINQERGVAAVKLLLENGADADARSDYGRSPLHQAVSPYPNREIIELLLEHGADANAADVNGHTALHRMIVRSDPDSDIVQLLVANGADVNARSFDGNTPLHFVVNDREPSVFVVQLLLANGADVNARSFDGNTPLHFVVNDREPSVFVVQLLLDHGADLDAPNNDGATACAVAEESMWFLHYALEDIRELLCK